MTKQKWTIIGFLVLVLIVAAGLLRVFSGDEDTWLCQNGQWVKHGNPSAPMPTSGCGTPVASPTPSAQLDITVTVPQPDSIISSPLIIEGQAGGNWFFEASAPVKLLDQQGNQLASGIIQAQGDWMTEDFVPFVGEISFNIKDVTPAILLLQNDNPSGLPEFAKEIRVPLVLNPSETTKVKVYFNNDRLDPEFSCNKVFPVERDIPRTLALARAALDELLKGPVDNEKVDGFFTNINSGVKIQKLTIENGVAKVDFAEQLEFQVGGSCRVAAIRAEITETLKQFFSVKSVIISIDGRTEDVLQP